ELVAGSAGPGAGRVATLGHEAVDDAMEGRAVVEAGARQVDEVLDGERRAVRVELDREVALLGLEGGGVRLRGVEGAGRRRGSVGHRISLGELGCGSMLPDIGRAGSLASMTRTLFT